MQIQQKIIEIGNSSGVIIPREVLKKLKIRTGKMITISINEEKETTITPKFAKLLERVNKHYASALRELSNK